MEERLIPHSPPPPCKNPEEAAMTLLFADLGLGNIEFSESETAVPETRLQTFLEPQSGQELYPDSFPESGCSARWPSPRDGDLWPWEEGRGASQPCGVGAGGALGAP